MKQIVSFLIAVLAMTLTAMNSQAQYYRLRASDNIVAKKVSLGKFDAIKASMSTSVYYTPGSGKAYAYIRVPDNLEKYLKVEVKDETLYVRFKFPNNNYGLEGNLHTEIYVYAPAVTNFSASTAARITLPKGLDTASKLNISVSSSGDFVSDSPVKCLETVLDGSSAGRITLPALSSGKVDFDVSSSTGMTIHSLACNSLNVDASSAAQCVIETLSCNSLKVDASSASNCKVSMLKCKEGVEVEATSAAKVILAGTCKQASYEVNSTAHISAENLKAGNVKADASSGGDIHCYTNGVLDTSYSSGGNIRYKGNPSRIIDRSKRSEGVSRL